MYLNYGLRLPITILSIAFKYTLIIICMMYESDLILLLENTIVMINTNAIDSN